MIEISQVSFDVPWARPMREYAVPWLSRYWAHTAIVDVGATVGWFYENRSEGLPWGEYKVEVKR